MTLRINSCVTARYRVDADKLWSRRRTQNLVLVRFVMYYLYRVLTGLSFPNIGLYFRRNHTSILHGYRTIAARIKSHPAFGVEVEQLKQEILTGVSISDFASSWVAKEVDLEVA